MYAWITPDEPSETTRLIEIRVPDDVYLYSCFIGAVLLLCDSANWEEVGLVTVEEAIALFKPTLEDVLSNA